MDIFECASLKKKFFSITDFKESFRFELSCLRYMYMGTQTHTHALQPPAQSFLSRVLKYFPHFHLFQNQRFCANLFGRAKASLFTIEEIWNKTTLSPAPLAPSNHSLVEHKYAQWKQTNKQKLKPWSHHFGGSRKLICKGPELERFFFF